MSLVTPAIILMAGVTSEAGNAYSSGTPGSASQT